jgi:hypothetical protein
MKIRFTILLALILSLPACIAQQVPEGYIMQYQQIFSTGKALADFKVDNPDSWGIFQAGSNFYLHFAGSPEHAGSSVLPLNMAILGNQVYGDFILEADVMPVPDTSGLGEICLFLGLKDKSTYYYIQLTNQGNRPGHGTYLVKDSVPKLLVSKDLQPVIWKTGKWQKVRLERNIVKRTILVFLDNMKVPVLQTKDYELVMGSVGFGSFSSPGSIDNIRIWAPTVISEE